MEEISPRILKRKVLLCSLLTSLPLTPRNPLLQGAPLQPARIPPTQLVQPLAARCSSAACSAPSYLHSRPEEE